MLTRLLAFVRGLARRRLIDVEVDDELQFHLDRETQAHIARGVSPEEARRLAILSLGGITQTKEAVRDVRTTWLDAAWRETRLAVRTLRAAPAFTVPAVVVLALGIGGTTVVFGVIDGVLLRPLTFDHPEEIVRVWSSNEERRIAFLSVSPADFEDWQARTSLGQLAAYERPRAMLWRGRGVESLTAMAVTPRLFQLLGVSPALGRALTTDEAAGTPAVISHALWQGRFGGATNVIGRTIATDEHSWTIVGVMPRWIRGTERPGRRVVPARDTRRLRCTIRSYAARRGADTSGPRCRGRAPQSLCSCRTTGARASGRESRLERHGHGHCSTRW